MPWYSHHSLAGVRPLGIRSTEVDGYATWLDVSFSDSVGRPVPVYYISASGRSKRCSWEDDGRGWDRRWLEGEGYGDSVKVRRMRSEDGGLLVELKEGTLLREQRAFVLRPAGPGSIRQKYLEMLATEMGLLDPGAHAGPGDLLRQGPRSLPEGGGGRCALPATPGHAGWLGLYHTVRSANGV